MRSRRPAPSSRRPGGRGPARAERSARSRAPAHSQAPGAQLVYALGASECLVHIDDVPRGMRELHCPYCGHLLVARKGRVLAHHFAHAGDTCLDSARSQSSALPLLDDLDAWPGLQRGDLRFLRRLRRWREIGASSVRGRERRALARLIDAGLIEEVPAGQRWVDGVGSHRHSSVGRLVAAAVGLELAAPRFAELQRTLFRARLEQLEWTAASARAAVDLRLYRARLERIESLALYLLDVRTGDRTLHKVGVTSRPLEERLAEVRADLARCFGEVTIDVVGLWPGRGSVELYLKRKLARYQVRLGARTEYFDLASAGPRSAGARTLRELGRWAG